MVTYARRVASYHGLIFGLLVVIGSFSGTSVNAQTPQELNWCNGKDGATAELQISGCTAVIQSGKFAGNNLAIVFLRRGSSYYATRDYDRAIADYNEAIRLNPNYAAAITNRGEAYLLKKDYQRAIADYDQAIKLDATNWSSFNGRGAAFFRLRQYDQALRNYGEALRLNPKHPWPWLNRCEVYIIQNDLSAALNDCNKAIVELGYSFARHYRAIAYIKLGRLDEAIADFDEALQRSPKFANAFYGRGVAKKKKGDIRGAEADVATAKALRADVADEFIKYAIE